LTQRSKGDCNYKWFCVYSTEYVRALFAIGYRFIEEKPFLIAELLDFILRVLLAKTDLEHLESIIISSLVNIVKLGFWHACLDYDK
jgi:hypothetical protein